MSSTWATLRNEISENIGDYLHSTVTTAITTNTSVTDTSLANVRGGKSTDYFVGWWGLITSGANSGALRSVTAYNATTNTLTVSGANFTTDGATLATYELHKIDPREKLRAANQSARELYPVLYKRLYDDTLVSGSILPNAHFEDWLISTYPDFYRVTNAAAVATTTAGLYRGGAKSAKVTASSANGYLGLSSDQFPRLIDVQGNSFTFEAWAYPEVSNDAVLELYSIKPDGTAQTLTSTTASYAGKWNLITLEGTCQDDISTIQARFKVKTNGKYVYWDASRLTGVSPSEYLLPTAFQTGQMTAAYQQVSGKSAAICDDLGNVNYAPVYATQVYSDGWYKWVRTPDPLGSDAKIALVGEGVLEDTTSADTDTVSVDDPHTALFTSYTCMILYQNLRNQPSGGTMDIYAQEMARWAGKVESLKQRLRMAQKPMKIGWRLP